VLDHYFPALSLFSSAGMDGMMVTEVDALKAQIEGFIESKAATKRKREETRRRNRNFKEAEAEAEVKRRIKKALASSNARLQILRLEIEDLKAEIDRLLNLNQAKPANGGSQSLSLDSQFRQIDLI
jgi:FtsZ-binding cell division protein ZapB